MPDIKSPAQTSLLRFRGEQHTLSVGVESPEPGTIAHMDANCHLSSLPTSIREAIAPLLEALPINQAMPVLVGGRPQCRDLAETAIRSPAIAARAELSAAIWLYVDELDKSHTLSQQIDTPTGAFLHGIMHRREGDFWNSHYWFRRVGHHPAMGNIGDYDAHAFIDEVEKARPNDPRLVDLQRREWAALFSSCANQ